MKSADFDYDPMIIRKVTRRIPINPSKRGVWLIAIPTAVVLIGALYLLWFYISAAAMIEEHLRSQKWALPSTIYADAPVLYEGMPIKKSHVLDYLENLNYQKVESEKVNSGEYVILKEGILFKKNPQVLDRREEPPILVEVDNSSIAAIKNFATGEELPAFELEPVAISNLFGKEWEKRTLVNYSDLPKHLVQAVVSIEDRRFFEHHGIDVQAIGRAVWMYIAGDRRLLQGGSTITQQLAKNFYLSPERSVKRKVSEAIMALSIEKRKSKEEILEMYLNEIYLGQRGAMSINGVGEASKLFFRKGVQHITVPEAALLAGMIQAPSAYNPYRNPENAKSRRDTVLLAMKKMDFLSEEEYKKYRNTEIKVYAFDEKINLAPYFGTLVKAQLLEKYPKETIYTKNLHVYTTLDLRLQRYAEEALTTGLRAIDRIRGKQIKKKAQGALIAIEPQTGYIRAFVGGRDFSSSQFDRIRQALRQPGSVFKPVVYAAALEQAFSGAGSVYTPASLVKDEPWTLRYHNRTWQPKNYDGQYHGVVTLRKALAQSMNIATAKLAQQVGLPQVTQLAKNLGFENVKAMPSVSLGAFEVTPWQVATAYTVFANGGVMTELRGVEKVADSQGKTLERSKIEVKRVLHPQTAYIITDMMRSVMTSGTGAGARRYGFTRSAAGKTGTTDEFRDAWFVGYTPNLLCVVWVGYDDNTPLRMNGAQAALPIWGRFMTKATANQPIDTFTSPQGVVTQLIDPMTGQVATEDCPSAVTEIFIQGTEPTEYCALHSFGYTDGYFVDGQLWMNEEGYQPFEGAPPEMDNSYWGSPQEPLQPDPENDQDQHIYITPRTDPNPEPDPYQYDPPPTPYDIDRYYEEEQRREDEEEENNFGYTDEDEE